MKFANLLATKEIIKKFESRGVIRSHRSRSILRSKVMTTQLGFGTYRVHVDSKEHETSMLAALQSGVNLMDTSSNYGLGGSEELISRVLDKMGKEDARDSFVIVTKSGYIQGPMFEQLQQLDAKEVDHLDIVKVSANCWHSVHPDILQLQLDQSFKRMNISGVDALLLHNPEYYLQDCARKDMDQELAKDSFYQRIKKAFLFLEKQVQEQKIKYYGVSSNSMCAGTDSYDQVSLVKLYEIANECSQELYSNDQHHFQVIQFPCNLLESDGIIHKTLHYQGQEFSTLDLANHLKLDVLFNRPLNAFHNGRMIRLAQGDFNIDVDYPAAIHEAFEKIKSLESSIGIYLNRHLTVLEQMQSAAKRSGFFEVAASLPEFVVKCHDNEQYFQMVQSWLWPYISTSLDCLHKFYKGDPEFDLSQFTNDYLKAFDQLESLVIPRNHQIHDQDHLKGLRECLKLGISDSISQFSLNLLASLPGKPIILNGMRDIKWVKDSTSILIEDDLSNAVEILQEIHKVY
ncbi:aldo/keto reductase [bacterium]|nr:aldo/keto reductase [bacterium]